MNLNFIHHQSCLLIFCIGSQALIFFLHFLLFYKQKLLLHPDSITIIKVSAIYFMTMESHRNIFKPFLKMRNDYQCAIITWNDDIYLCNHNQLEYCPPHMIRIRPRTFYPCFNKRVYGNQCLFLYNFVFSRSFVLV